MAKNRKLTLNDRVQKGNDRGTVVAVLRSAANERALRVRWDAGHVSLEITRDVRRVQR